jgi:hypothetical protein
MSRRRAAVVACGLLLGSGSAWAQNTPYTLFYLPAEGCPTAEQFAAELSARAPWLVEAEEEAALAIEVSFEQATAINGVLVLRDADGQTTTRSVPGASCAEVVSALALITTVLIDAQRSESPPTPPVPEALKPAPPPAPALERPRARKPSHFRLGFGAGASVNGGVAPSTALAGTFEFSGEWSPTRLFSPLVSLSAERSLPDDTSTAGGAARFRWSVLRAGACPLRTSAGSALAFRPCALFEGGILEADGSDIEHATRTRSPWWSIGAAARLELALLDPLAVILEGGGRYHLRRDSFYFASGAAEGTIFAVPPGGGFGRVAMLARW